MEKAYDTTDLVAKLKSRGLDLAEEGAKIVLEEVEKWVTESAKLSATPYDDLALIILPQLKTLALSQIDKIDGAVG